LTLIGHAKKTSIKDLSEMLGMSSSAVTQFVDSLVQSGYVTRQEDPKDRRSTQIGLSPKGKKHIAATKEKRITEMESLFDAITDSELEEYARLQKKITSGFLDKRS
jgi:DNA-binding MarR family transcriptional regulator